MLENVDSDPKLETASPRTAFALTKSIQALGSELLKHTSEQTLKEFNELGEKAFLIGSNKQYFGQLEEWDGKFFSFAKLGISPKDQHPDALLPHCIIQIDFQTDDRPTRGLPDGTFLTLDLETESKYVGEGGTFKREVAFRQEGPPMVEDWVVDYINHNPNHSWLRIDSWRELTEPETQDLLFDITDLRSRLDNYLGTHDGPLFAE